MHHVFASVWLEYRASNYETAPQIAEQHADQAHPGEQVRLAVMGPRDHRSWVRTYPLPR